MLPPDIFLVSVLSITIYSRVLITTLPDQKYSNSQNLEPLMPQVAHGTDKILLQLYNLKLLKISYYCYIPEDLVVSGHVITIQLKWVSIPVMSHLWDTFLFVQVLLEG